MANTIQGEVLTILNESGQGKNGPWERKIVVVKTNKQYRNTVPVEFRNTDLACKVGDSVEVSFFIDGREYNGKYYVSLEGQGVKVLGQGSPGGVMKPNEGFNNAPITDEMSDLPF